MTKQSLRWTGIVLIVITGLIHLYETPEYLDTNTVIGTLFILNDVGALVSAVGIYRGARDWGWGLGVVVAGGAFIAFILSRTVGLFGFQSDEWEALGLISLVVEGLFVLAAARALSTRSERTM